MKPDNGIAMDVEHWAVQRRPDNGIAMDVEHWAVHKGDLIMALQWMLNTGQYTKET